ncbi:hypothetical protein KVR01_005961 [Diaporthe batatas]|uniref:uncharacterized protein n=1 Tax=Diaporthe batatas TaxID=748121 RepID=UPI001D051D1B|nr:uncharacterized protein KVR01_005961 [Diaporthe batatas]KAG8164043.1 hypothetical protein KVR01_005961 [Diaporthe batatas]
MAILNTILDAGIAVRPATIAAVILGAILTHLLVLIVYNLFFHPLRAVPGPLLSRATPWPWALRQSFGVQAFYTHRQHAKYGPVVRIGPNHLTFTDPRAWKDIYGHRTGGEKDGHQLEMSKSSATAHPISALPTTIINSDKEEHQRLRRALSHGFSDAAIRSQEPLIMKHVGKMISGLKDRCQEGKPLNMEAWYNWTTFDVVGELVFGLSFGCLDKFEYNPWVHSMLEAIKYGASMSAMVYVGSSALVNLFFRFVGSKHLKQLNKYTNDMVVSRLNLNQERNDLFEGMVKKQAEWKMSFEKLSANAEILVLAGSETTATLLSGCTYLLLTNPDKMEKLKHEVRSSFRSEHEITASSVNNLTYMLANLNEALRLYPPVTSSLIRVVPKGGDRIADLWVPEGTMVECQHWSMNHSAENWADPWEFKPERFLEDVPGNKMEALQAFSVGPRNCIGRNLAYVEMRIILARLIYNFDLRLSEDSQRWIERQRSYALWSRIPLYCYLTRVSENPRETPLPTVSE